MTTHQSRLKATDFHRRTVSPSIVQRKSDGAESASSIKQRLGNQGVGQLMNEMSRNSNRSSSPAIQTKLTISQPGDAHEREADRVAEAVMRMPESSVQSTPAMWAAGAIPELQRMCTKCDDDHEKKTVTPLQRKEQTADVPAVTSSVAASIQSLRGGGSSLPAATRAFFEPRFGSDFSGVRVHTDERADTTAKSIGARAFTTGNNIGFAKGEYSPNSSEGQRLLAHELTHVLQQSGEQVERATVFRVPRVGTRFTHPAGARSPHASLTAEFDGRNFTLTGSGSTLLTTAAQSGRPVSVRSRDAATCGGSTSDCYTNDPRYVGITDYGPIPEGTYRFRATDFATFSAAEQLLFTPGGSFEDPFGRRMHGGDWGAGRVPLNPVRITPGPRGCGNTRRRSGFFLHGGSLSGSSGCIDVGNAGIAAILPHLTGYRRNIEVTVRYGHPAPGCGTLQRIIGGATYPGQRDPSLTDRVRGAWRELTGEGAE